MNKSERLIVALLFGLLVVWSIYGRKLAPQQPQAEPQATEQTATAVTNAPQTASSPELNSASATAAATNQSASAKQSPVAVEAIHTKPQKVLMLTNDVLNVAFSSWGGGIVKAELVERSRNGHYKYPQTNSPSSGPLVLDFAKRPALSYNDLPGLSSLSDYKLEKVADNRLKISGKGQNGLRLERSVAATNGYIVTVTDTISNTGNKPLQLKVSGINLGPMDKIHTKASTRGFSYLGVETKSSEPDRVIRWDKQLPGLFGVSGGCSRPNLTNVPLVQDMTKTLPLDWVAVKNKYFVQILMLKDGAQGCTFFAERKDDPIHFMLENVAAAANFKDIKIAPGDKYTRTMNYYVGPKVYSQLRALGDQQDRIILRSWKGFGWWRWACAGVLWLLNALYAITRNYGVAIILLTIIARVVFWPVTRKGTESMKKMKEIQPELTELRKKYKNDPKKMQEQQMLLYRAHGINPVAGCLPMLVQMPVFIALYTVLRNAVELRFQSFLWIKDLCEPEGLLAGVISFPASGINILPLLMAATMAVQQKLTPTAGDPQQQKMMMFMPLMMLFFFYNMASALVLYWTVSQLLSILQLVLQQRKDKLKAA